MHEQARRGWRKIKKDGIEGELRGKVEETENFEHERSIWRQLDNNRIYGKKMEKDGRTKKCKYFGICLAGYTAWGSRM
jgi:hypothetical protein